MRVAHQQPPVALQVEVAAVRTVENARASSAVERPIGHVLVAGWCGGPCRRQEPLVLGWRLNRGGGHAAGGRAAALWSLRHLGFPRRAWSARAPRCARVPGRSWRPRRSGACCRSLWRVRISLRLRALLNRGPAVPSQPHRVPRAEQQADRHEHGSADPTSSPTWPSLCRIPWPAHFRPPLIVRVASPDSFASIIASVAAWRCDGGYRPGVLFSTRRSPVELRVGEPEQGRLDVSGMADIRGERAFGHRLQPGIHGDPTEVVGWWSRRRAALVAVQPSRCGRATRSTLDAHPAARRRPWHTLVSTDAQPARPRDVLRQQGRRPHTV